jgi:hypothetical protein
VTVGECLGRLVEFTAWAAAAAMVGCDASVTSLGVWLPPTGFYLEAEDGELSGAFAIESDPLASRALCIDAPGATTSLDQPGPARARYPFAIATPGRYLVWGRIHSPDPLHNTFWIQLDRATWYLWRITTGDVWYWNRFHDNFDYETPLTFDLAAGSHELVIANSVEGDRVDRFYVTADGDVPPGNDTPCTPPHSIQLDGGCTPSCGSQGGNECGRTACTGRTILPAYDCEVCCIVP